MKKYILLFIISIVLAFTLGVGVNHSRNAFEAYEESFYKTRTNCVDLNGIYENDSIKIFCENYIKKVEYKDSIGLYYINYEDRVDNIMDESFGYTSIFKYVLFILIGLDSIWFVNDFFKGKKMTKKNKDELRKKAIGVSLIPSIPFIIYSLLKVLSPFVVVKDYLVFEKGEIKTTICYLLAGILISLIVSLIGLVLSKRNYNTIKNLMGIILLLVLVELSIFAATEFINTVFVVYYEGLETFCFETACTLQVLLLAFTVGVGLILYKFVPSLKESK